MEGDETRTLATRRDFALERDQESVPARERRTLSWLDLGEPCADLRSFHSPHNTTRRLVAPRPPPRRTPSLPLETVGRIIESAYPVYSDDGGERREVPPRDLPRLSRLDAVRPTGALVRRRVGMEVYRFVHCR